MKELRIFLVAVAISVAAMGCGGGGAARQAEEEFVEVKQMAPELYALAETINKKGGIAEVAYSESPRQDFAEQKAVMECQRKISERYEAKVQTLTKKFAEEIQGNTSAGGPEINEAFTNVMKVSSKNVLQGATKLAPPKAFKKKDGQYRVYVVYGMDPDMLNQSIIDQTKTNPKLYERFRASQAYKELEKEMAEYDSK
jgi:ribosomal protein S20